jgi:hypothetical protein
MSTELLRSRFDNAFARSGGIGLGPSHRRFSFGFDNFYVDDRNV